MKARAIPGGANHRGKKQVKPQVWNLKLYIAGHTPNSVAAIANLQELCENRLQGRYRIEIIDLLKKPQLAKGDQIIAVPTLVRKLPTPIKKIIGNLSVADRVLVGLDLEREK